MALVRGLGESAFSSSDTHEDYSILDIQFVDNEYGWAADSYDRTTNIQVKLFEKNLYRIKII